MGEQFPFWSESTIKRGIATLEKMGVLLSCNQNKASFDKTKWYTIDYERLAEIEQEKEAETDAMPESRTAPEAAPDKPEIMDMSSLSVHETAPKPANGASAQNDPIEQVNLTQSLVQIDPMERISLTQPIPETTQRLRQIQDDDDSPRRTGARAQSTPGHEASPGSFQDCISPQETGPTFESMQRLIDKRFLNIIPGEAATIVQEAQERGYSPLALFRLIAEAAPYYDTITRPSAYVRRIMIQWEDMGRLDERGQTE